MANHKRRSGGGGGGVALSEKDFIYNLEESNLKEIYVSDTNSNIQK